MFLFVWGHVYSYILKNIRDVGGENWPPEQEAGFDWLSDWISDVGFFNSEVIKLTM